MCMLNQTKRKEFEEHITGNIRTRHFFKYIRSRKPANTGPLDDDDNRRLLESAREIKDIVIKYLFI